MSSISSEEIISILKSEIENFDSEATDKETGTVGVRAVFPNSSRLLHSGASGNVLYLVYMKNVL